MASLTVCIAIKWALSSIQTMYKKITLHSVPTAIFKYGTMGFLPVDTSVLEGFQEAMTDITNKNKQDNVSANWKPDKDGLYHMHMVNPTTKFSNRCENDIGLVCTNIKYPYFLPPDKTGYCNNCRAFNIENEERFKYISEMSI